MKVLIVRNALSYDFGGAERLAVHIAQELALNDIDTVVVSRQEKLLSYAHEERVNALRGWWWNQQNWSGGHIVLVPFYLLWQLVLFVWYILFIYRNRFDAVHLMSKDDFIAGTLAARVLGRSVIWTDTADLKHIFANHDVWYKNPVGKIVFSVSRLAKQVTLVSRSEQDLIGSSLKDVVPKNFKVVHIAGKDQTVTAIKRDDRDMGAVIFCSTSRLVVAKGIGELIMAFNELSRSSDKYRLWLVGDGPDSEQFKELAKSNRYIIFLGYQKEPLEYLAACDVFVQPTHHEGFSLSLTEAAMLAKPMIASNVGGNPELVNEFNGMLFPAKDIPALRLCMKILGNDSDLRQRLGSRARIDYKENFDFSTIIKREFIPLYENNN